MSICEAGQERLDADVDDEAAFDDGLDLALDEAVALRRPATILSQFWR